MLPAGSWSWRAAVTSVAATKSFNIVASRSGHSVCRGERLLLYNECPPIRLHAAAPRLSGTKVAANTFYVGHRVAEAWRNVSGGWEEQMHTRGRQPEKDYVSLAAAIAALLSIMVIGGILFTYSNRSEPGGPGPVLADTSHPSAR